MAKHTEHTILGVIENMSYFESKETGIKKYVFGKEEQNFLDDELETLFAELSFRTTHGIPMTFRLRYIQSDDRLEEIVYFNRKKKVITALNNKIENI